MQAPRLGQLLHRDGLLGVQPPLVISKEQADAAIDRIEEAFEDFEKGRIPDSVLATVKGW